MLETASEQTWTQDPFDRLIVAQAAINQNPVISKERRIPGNDTEEIW